MQGEVRIFQRCFVVALLLASWLVVAPGSARAQPAEETTQADVRQRAREHFEQGIEYFNQSSWEAALAEFMRSRQLYATRGNTHNAALCLRQLGRFDEALELLHALLREFPELPERAEIEAEIARLQARTGTLEVRGARGAAVVVDGRTRGTTPLSGPVRVNVGSHVVRIFKEGAAPFETRLEVAGGQHVVLEPRLTLLTRAGRLKVVERDAHEADVVVDGVVVGHAPWEGDLAPGTHSVALRSGDARGTQPARAPVRVGETTVLTLVVEPLACRLRIDPVPIAATVALDGVELGRGSWVGPVRCGKHRVEVAAEGFLPQRRSVSIDRTRPSSVSVELVRDPDSPLGREPVPARVTLEAAVGPLVAPSFFGDVADSCGAACRAVPPFGFTALLRGGYQFSVGAGLSLEVGFLWLRGEIADRDATVFTPQGEPNSATTHATDRLTLWGVLAGASASYQRGEAWPWTLRFGAGALLGAVDDRRTATIDGSVLGPASQRVEAHYFYVAPELQIARRFDHFELGAGLKPMLLVALVRPEIEFDCETGGCPTEPQLPDLAVFAQQTLTGSVLFVAAGTITARYSFF